MKTLLAAVVLLAMVGIGASAQIVQNGDFSQHITAFNAAFPGYSTGDFFTNPFPPYSTPTDPGPIPHWSSTATFQGTGVNSSVNNAFEPTGFGASGDPTDFAFIQGTNSLKQSIGLVVGNTYELTFVAAPRSGNAATATVSVGSGLTATSTSANGTLASDFTAGHLIFVATSGHETITLSNVVDSGDITEDFGDVEVVQIVPEPSSYALLGVGLAALFFVARRRA